jgi:flagellar hook protein FlgE
MSINSAMLSGVSGLVANSAALGAISDNIANANTVGYKRNVTQFEDLVTASAAVGSYNSGGVQATTSQLIDQQGQLSQSTSATDLGIAGNGFFVVTDNATGLTAADTRSFTRAGNFTPDSAGYLKNAAGLYLQGWLADSSGTITPNPSDISKLSTINVNNIGTVPDPTTTASLNLNLNSSQATSAQEATYNPAVAATSMAASTAGGTGVTPDYSTQLTVYDAKGSAHTFQLDFLKSATANQWHAEMVAVPASDVAGTTNGLISSGTVAFNPDGTLDTTNTTFSAAATSIGASTATTGVRWASSLGLPTQAVNVNLAKSPASVTQYASSSTLTSTTVDGGPAGTLTGVTVDKDGYVTANFSNGAQRKVAQVAVATFQNADGLQSISGDAYRATIGSGSFTLKEPGDGGAGNISPSTLESSTVDLSTEFTGLIITQRAYAASSKIITTADEMLQTLISSKQ